MLAFIFLGLLSFVKSDESVSGNDFGYDNTPFQFSFSKEKCVEEIDLATCLYMDSLANKLRNSDLQNLLRSKEPEDTRTTWNEISEENPEKIILGEVLYNSNNPIQKRFSVFRRKNPVARGYKRGPGFRSWGGKRDSEQYADKRTKFVSWGGKRDGELISEDKRTKFVSWGGKRDGESIPESSVSVEDNELDKRTKFQSWGGKRAIDFEDDRDYNAETATNKQMNKKGNNFSYYSETFKKHVPKRPHFQSWGGKRAFYPRSYIPPKVRMLLNGEKRTFSSWGGKRHNDGYENVRFQKSDEDSKRHVFQSWGGKRLSDWLPENFDSQESESYENIRNKREVTPNVQSEKPQHWKNEQNKREKKR